MAEPTLDENLARMVAEAVEVLNRRVMDANRAGLEVTLELVRMNVFGRGEVSTIKCKVSRPIKRG